MAQISSFKVAAGMIGIVAIAKASAFAVALLLFGAISAPQASRIATASIPINSQILAQK